MVRKLLSLLAEGSRSTPFQKEVFLEMQLKLLVFSPVVAVDPDGARPNGIQTQDRPETLLRSNAVWAALRRLLSENY
jgi:hypothetical protein